jgi:hypothetical protein
MIFYTTAFGQVDWDKIAKEAAEEMNNDSVCAENEYTIPVGVVDLSESPFETTFGFVLTETNFKQMLSHIVDEYAEECYKDSSKVYRHVRGNEEDYKRIWDYHCLMGNQGQCVNLHHWDEPYWQHREPTFKEFIKWLRK